MVDQKVVEGNHGLDGTYSVLVLLHDWNPQDSKPARHNSKRIFNDPSSARKPVVEDPSLWLKGLVWKGLHHGFAEREGVVAEEVERHLEWIISLDFRKVQTPCFKGCLQGAAVVDPSVVGAALGADVDVDEAIVGVGHAQKNDGEGILVIPEGGPDPVLLMPETEQTNYKITPTIASSTSTSAPRAAPMMPGSTTAAP
jgi:hypothetical protein